MWFFSKTTGGFYREDTHGPRQIAVPDPNWVRPADQPDAVAPTIEQQNPDTTIPLDAVEVTDEAHADLMAGQAAGRRIIADNDGGPILADQPSLSNDALMAALRGKRNNLLRGSDFTQLADAPYSDAMKARWATYRQALRDLPDTPGIDPTPGQFAWPVPPS